MNEWAARIMSVFPERNKADLDQFIQEVSNDDLERMYFQKEYDEEVECRPTFEQVSQERIIDEATKNLIVLKSLENVLNERMNGLNSFNASVLKTRPYFESFEHSDCSLKLALDSLFLYVEQEISQSRQSIFLGDIKRSLNEMRTDAQKRITDYQKEILLAEKEVSNAEKKLSKSKESYERSLEFRAKMEAFELDVLLSSARGKGGSKKENEDSVAKLEKETKDDVRNLLRAIGNKDQVLSASRRAFQKLDKECKKAVYFTLRKVVEKEKENALLHMEVMAKFEKTVMEIDVDNDINEFIQLNISESGAMELSSQALSLLGDLTPSQPTSMSPTGSSNSSTPRGSFTTPSSNKGPSLTSSNLHSHSKEHVKEDAYTSPMRNRSTSSASSGSAAAVNSQPQYHTPAAKLFALESAHNKHTPPNATNDELASYLTQIFYCTTATSPVNAIIADDSQVKVSSAEVASDIESADRNSLTEIDAVKNREHGEGDKALTHHSGTTPSLSQPSPFEDGDEDKPNPNDRASADYQKYKRSSLRALSIHSTPSAAGSNALAHDLDKKHTTRKSSMSPSAEESAAIKAEHRKAKVKMDDKHFDSLNDKYSQSAGYGWLRSNPDPSLVEAVEWMSRAVKSQSGRDIFIAELNQFRSKKVDVGLGFDALGAVLWTALSYCQSENDIHSAKILMMLSQTFYRQISDNDTNKEKQQKSDSNNNKNNSDHQDHSEDEHEDTDGKCKRGAEHRQYIKEKLLSHPIWQDGNYWEQALWQCAIQQLQTIPYDKAWYDMDKETRAMSVRRVHDVIFSQVMAITHSMMELGCSNEQSREFLYRMCVIHQLSEAQRQQLLQHVVGSSKDNH